MYLRNVLSNSGLGDDITASFVVVAGSRLFCQRAP
jgi:hypothetical protein